MKLTATPEQEDFSGKYENKGVIARYLVDSYFRSVQKLLQQTSRVQKAHEIGAGVGESTLKLKNMVSNLSASEFVPNNVAIASQLNPEISIIQENIYELQQRDESMDLLFLLEVLEHLDYPELALKELKRVSSKYLILGVPREPLWRLLNICRFKYVKDLGNTPGHLNHWSKRQIIKLVEKNFGDVIAVESPLPWTIILAQKSHNNQSPI